MAQSTPISSCCSRASFRCAYMRHIEKYVFQQESAAPQKQSQSGSTELLLKYVFFDMVHEAHLK